MMAALFFLILITLYLTWAEKHQWAIVLFLCDVVLSLAMLWHHMTDTLHVNF